MLKPLDWKTTSYKYKDGFIVEVTEINTKNDIEYKVEHKNRIFINETASQIEVY